MKKTFIALLLFVLGATAFAQKPVLVVPRGHSENIGRLLTTSDNKYLLSAAWDKSVRLWDLATGKELKSIEGFPSWVDALAVSADGDHFAAGTQKDLRIFSIKQGGKELARDTNAYSIKAMTYSPAGNELVTAESNYVKDKDYYYIRFWSADALVLHRTIRLPVHGDIIALQYRADGMLICLRDYNTLTIDPQKGIVVRKDSTEGYHRKALSPDGKFWAYEDFENGSAPTGIVNVVNTATNQTVKTFRGHRYSIKSLAFSPDGHYLATGADDATIIVWDLQRNELAYRLEGFGADTWSLSFNATSDKLISGNTDEVIRAWDFKNQKVLSQMGGFANTIYSIALDPAEKKLIVGGSNKKNHYLSILDLGAGAIKGNISAPGVTYKTTVSPDGKYLVNAFRGGDVRITDLQTGEEIKTFSERNTGWTSFDISPDGQKIAVGNGDGDTKVRVYSFPAGEVLSAFEVKPEARAIRFSADGKNVFVGTNNDKVECMNVSTGNRVMLYSHPGQYADVTRIIQILLTDNGQMITGDDYGTMRWWDIATGKELSNMKGTSSIVNDMQFLPGNREVVISGGDPGFFDPNINLIDINAKKIAAKLAGHANSATSFAITHDGKFLFSGSYDRTIRIWKLATNEMVGTMVFFDDKDWVIVDNAGRFDGTKAAMEKMYYTQGLTLLPLESGYEQFYTPSLLQRLLQGEQFTPPNVNINTLKPAPVVTIGATDGQRNLEVTDEIKTFTTDDASFTINVKADCPEDAVTEIRLYQNGKLVQTTRNLEVTDDTKGEKSITKHFPVTLTTGENKFKAIAYNSQRTESRPAEIIVRFTGSDISPAQSETSMYVVVVGINTYKNPKYTLNYAGADASAFKEKMASGNKDIFKNVEVVYLADAEATKSNIEAAFRKAAAKCKQQDVFIFYYAGHGVMSGGEGNKKDFFIVPYDVTQLYGADDALAQKGISSQELQDLSKNIPAQKQLFILDACQSAGALEAVASRGAAEEKAIAQLARSTGTHWLTASASDQFASEFQQLGHGIFTYVLLQALTQGTGAGDKVSVNSLKAYLETQVPELSQKYKGNPQYPASYGYGNDFPIMIIK